MADMDMSALFQAIGVAIRDAQQAIETHAVQQFVQHFEQLPPAQARAAMGEKAPESPDAADAAAAPEPAEAPPVLAPRMLRVALPGPGGTPRLAEVPTVALSHHSALALDQVTVRLTVSASLDDTSKRLRVTPLALKAAPGEAAEKPKDAQEIELVFKRDEAPEGFARLSREAVKLL